MEREITKGNFYAGKGPIKIWDLNVDDTVKIEIKRMPNYIDGNLFEE